MFSRENPNLSQWPRILAGVLTQEQYTTIMLFRNFLDSRLFNAASGEGEGGGDGTPPSDPGTQQPPALTLEAIVAALKPLITDEVNGLDARLQKELKKLKTTPPPPPTGSGDGKPKDGADPFKDDRERELNERLARLEQEREAERKSALEKETDAEIKSSLAEFTWSEGDGKSIAFDYYRAKAKRDEDGNLVIGQMPLSKFIKEHASRNFKNYFQTRDVGGSGNPGRNQATNSRVDLKNITPGMSKDVEQAVVADIISALAAGRE